MSKKTRISERPASFPATPAPPLWEGVGGRLFLYFKQAWNLIRQEKLFSSIYIIGTGLSITMVMVLSILVYIKTANIYPETNRDRMLVANRGEERFGKGGMSSSQLSLSLIETCFKSIEDAETVSAIYDPWEEENYIQPVGSDEQWPATVKYTDEQFWTVFPFRFIEGRPFNESEMQSGIKTAVIAESLARKLFGTPAEAVGKYVSFNFREYRVCGVVKDVSFAMPNTYAQIWIPYTTFSDYASTFGRTGSLGGMSAYILAPSAKDARQIKSEAEENIRKYSQMLGEGIEFTTKGQPDLYWQYAFRRWDGFHTMMIIYGVVFLILLLVPAVSLSGMTESRMERRITEMGVRRAFGAPVNRLMNQVITENFLFTLAGGFIGLLLSCLIILFGKSWILQIGTRYANTPPEGADIFLSADMLLNFRVFVVALLVCFVLNLLSSLIPAWRASRKQIVYSLTAKE